MWSTNSTVYSMPKHIPVYHCVRGHSEQRLVCTSFSETTTTIKGRTTTPETSTEIASAGSWSRPNGIGRQRILKEEEARNPRQPTTTARAVGFEHLGYQSNEGKEDRSDSDKDPSRDEAEASSRHSDSESENSKVDRQCGIGRAATKDC